MSPFGAGFTVTLSFGVLISPSAPGTVIPPSGVGFTVTSSPFPGVLSAPGTVIVPSGLTVPPLGTLTSGAFSPGLTVPPSGKVTLPSLLIVGFCVAPGFGATVGLSAGSLILLSAPGKVIVPSGFGLTTPLFGVLTVPSGLTVEPSGTVTGSPFPGVTVPPSGKVTPPSGVIVGFCVASGLGVTTVLSSAVSGFLSAPGNVIVPLLFGLTV